MERFRSRDFLIKRSLLRLNTTECGLLRFTARPSGTKITLITRFYIPPFFFLSQASFVARRLADC